ncbi:BLUF domain-containing protein [Rhodopseudomonas sp.]|uniref:BLUF domain-containing protein n=1 Tax=Rhodopseudomonas sp. TaxID=1078 RepID=UPI0039E6D134
MFNRGLFAQVLEGPCPSVESLFEKILRDERHGDIQVLGFGAARERMFSNWSMAFLGRSREDQDLFGHFGRQTGFKAERIEGDRLLEIVRHLAFEEEARAA